MTPENAVFELLSSSLIVKYFDLSELTVPFHYHPQYELVCMESGSGFRIIGDKVSEFRDDDMVFVTSFLPHVWKKSHVIPSTSDRYRYYVLHFTPELMTNLLSFPELEAVHRFLDRAKCGLHIYGETSRTIRRLIKEAYQADPMDRFIHFLQILNVLQASKEFSSLSSVNFAHLHSSYKSDRMNKVCEYIGENFDRDVTVEEISDIACLSPTSFCRYFKKETGTSFVNYLNDVRIGYAQNLLLLKKYKIAEVAEMCGFRSVSYFNRVFKLKNGNSPLDYGK